MTFIQNECGISESFGTIWMNTHNWSGVSISLASNTYKELTSLGTNFTLISPSPDFAMTTDGRLKYTGLNTRNFMVSGYVSVSDTGRHGLAIFKNGTLVTSEEAYSLLAKSTSVIGPVTMSTNDYVSLWLKRSSGTTVGIYQITLGAAYEI